MTSADDTSPVGTGDPSTSTIPEPTEEEIEAAAAAAAAAKEKIRMLEEEKQKKLEQMERQRKEVLKEILKTEQTYVASLKILNTHFIIPLQEKYSKYFNEEINSTFMLISVILGVNEALLLRLEEYAKSDQSGSLGQIFLTLAPFLKSYSQYCNSYEVVFKYIEDLRAKHKSFNQFIMKKEAEPICQNLALFSYLIMPVQRIPRYNLLLKELISNTQPNHFDYATLCSALEKTKSIAAFVNSRLKDDENLSKIRELDNQIYAIDSSKQDQTIIQPGRKYVDQIEGVVQIALLKSNNNNNNSSSSSSSGVTPTAIIKKRHLILFNDALYITSDKSTSQKQRTYLLPSQRYKFISMINFRTVNALPWARPFTSPQYPDMKALQIVTHEDTFLLFFETTELMQRWAYLFNFQVENLAKHTPGLREQPPAPLRYLNDNPIFLWASLDYIRKVSELPCPRPSLCCYSNARFAALTAQRTVCIARALRAHHSVTPYSHELNFEAGDEFIVHSFQNDGWWWATKKQKKNKNEEGAAAAAAVAADNSPAAPKQQQQQQLSQDEPLEVTPAHVVGSTLDTGFVPCSHVAVIEMVEYEDEPTIETLNPIFELSSASFSARRDTNSDDNNNNNNSNSNNNSSLINNIKPPLPPPRRVTIAVTPTTTESQQQQQQQQYLSLTMSLADFDRFLFDLNKLPPGFVALMVQWGYRRKKGRRTVAALVKPHPAATAAVPAPPQIDLSTLVIDPDEPYNETQNRLFGRLDVDDETKMDSWQREMQVRQELKELCITIENLKKANEENMSIMAAVGEYPLSPPTQYPRSPSGNIIDASSGDDSGSGTPQQPQQQSRRLDRFMRSRSMVMGPRAARPDLASLPSSPQVSSSVVQMTVIEENVEKKSSKLFKLPSKSGSRKG